MVSMECIGGARGDEEHTGLSFAVDNDILFLLLQILSILIMVHVERVQAFEELVGDCGFRLLGLVGTHSGYLGGRCGVC